MNNNSSRRKIKLVRKSSRANYSNIEQINYVQWTLKRVMKRAAAQMKAASAQYQQASRALTALTRLVNQSAISGVKA